LQEKEGYVVIWRPRKMKQDGTWPIFAFLFTNVLCLIGIYLGKLDLFKISLNDEQVVADVSI
jgi:hypothetical protein